MRMWHWVTLAPARGFHDYIFLDTVIKKPPISGDFFIDKKGFLSYYFYTLNHGGLMYDFTFGKEAKNEV